MEALEKTKKKPSDFVAITEKQFALAKAIIEGKGEGKTKAELLKSVGYAEITAKKRPDEMFSSKGVQNALISMGITPEKLLKPAVDALQANQTTAYQGEIFQSDVPDLTLRMKGADQIAEILGLKKQVIEQRTVNVNVEFEDINHLFGS